jgi:alkylation response protein AidB-like acyl-CoA dehydrogenase
MSNRADVAGELIEWLRDYGEKRINSRLIDERRCLPPHIVLDFGNRGLFGLEAPECYGGLGLSVSDALRVYTQLAAIDATVATLVFLHNTNGVRPILHHAPQALRDELMPMLARGRELAAFALSEPEAGSSLGALTARIVPEGDAWKIHGVKRWNGSGWAGVISVFAREQDESGRLRGFTGFAVRTSEAGVRLGAESLTMGIRGIIQNSVEFHGVRATSDRMLGEPGRGLRVVEDVLLRGRLATGAVALGISMRSAQLILRYTSRREIETGLLLENPQTGIRLSELLHRIAIGRELLRTCGQRLDAGEELPAEIAMAVKVQTTDTANFAADLLVQLLGGRGYMETNLAPQIFRDARMLSIGEGANETLIAGLGRGVRMGHGVPAFLRSYDAGGEVVDRLMAISTNLEQHCATMSMAGYSPRVWQDAVRGRLAVAALGVAAARGDSQAITYARTEFERLCAEAEAGPSGSLPGTADIRKRIE